MTRIRITLAVATALIFSGLAAGEAPFAAQDRNKVSAARNLPVRFGESNAIWQQRLTGKWALAQPLVVGDNLLVGGDARCLPDDDLRRGNPRGGSMLCFDRVTGNLKWQLSLPGDSYAGSYGVCTPPAVQGDRLYVHGNLFIACVDLKGLTDGNDGPFTDELKLYSRHAEDEPIQQLKGDYADIIWIYDLKSEHGIYMHDASAGIPLIDGDLLWCTTSNALGRDSAWTPTEAPYVVVLDKATGSLVARDAVDIPQVFHGSWSTLTGGTANGQRAVFWADGYGFLRAFARPEPRNDGQVATLEQIWTLDANPSHYRTHEGKRILYTRHNQLYPKYPKNVEYAQKENHRANCSWGPCEFIATPVVHEGKLFIGIGRDHYYTLTEEGSKLGGFYRIEPDMKGDLGVEAVDWTAPAVGRTQCTASIVGDLLFIADMTGALTCLDIRTGKAHWQEKIGKHITCRSQWVADGKVYLSNDRGEMHVWAADATKKLLGVSKLGGKPATPTAVDGVIYIVNGRHVTAYSVENQPAQDGESSGQSD
jgi:outer membrane protein assembly factor BamB